MKRYEVRLLGEKLGEKHYGIFDTDKGEFVRDCDGALIMAFTSQVVAAVYANELNEKK